MLINFSLVKSNEVNCISTISSNELNFNSDTWFIAVTAFDPISSMESEPSNQVTYKNEAITVGVIIEYLIPGQTNWTTLTNLEAMTFNVPTNSTLMYRAKLNIGKK